MSGFRGLRVPEPYNYRSITGSGVNMSRFIAALSLNVLF